TERQRVDGADRPDAGNACDAVHRVAEDPTPPGRIRVARIEPESEGERRTRKPRIDVPERQVAAPQEARAREEHDRESHLGDDERLPDARAAGRSNAASKRAAGA